MGKMTTKRRLKTIGNTVLENIKEYNNKLAESHELYNKQVEDLCELVSRLMDKYQITILNSADAESLEEVIEDVVQEQFQGKITLEFEGRLTAKQIGEINRIIPMFVFSETNRGMINYYTWVFDFKEYYRVDFESEVI